MRHKINKIIKKPYDSDGWPIKYDDETAEANYAIKVCIEFEYEK